MRCIALGAALILSGALAQAADEQNDSTPAVTESEAIGIGRMVELLGEKGNVDIVNTPLSDVCRDIAKNRKIKIVFDQPALDKAGIRADALVNFASEKITLRDFLFKLFDPHGLTYKIRPDGLLITTLPKKSD